MPLLAVPQSLEKELGKAVYLLKEFTANSSSGPDKLIPSSVFAKAKGIAIISYTKMGFFVSARGGSGIVMAKLPDGKWSAPSAVGIAGLGGGFEFGAELTAIIMMLMYKKAVRAFMKGRNVALGGGISVAAGPVGRMIEGDVALKSPAAMYTYAKAKGLFVGINLSGTVILERRKANEKEEITWRGAPYLVDITCFSPGVTDPAPGPMTCYQILDAMTRDAQRKGFKQAVDLGSKAVEKKYGVKGLNKMANKSADTALDAEDRYHNRHAGGDARSSSSTRGNTRNFSNARGNTRQPAPRPAPTKKKTTTALFSKSKSNKKNKNLKVTRTSTVRRPAPGPPPSRSTKHKGPAPRPDKGRAPPRPTAHAPLHRTNNSPTGQLWGEAKFPFKSQMMCDLSFEKNDRIEILTKTACEFDWWEGRINDRTGIFPANYIKVLS